MASKRQTQRRTVATTMTEQSAPPGPVSLFRGKLRKPVTLTLIPQHHLKVASAVKRLKLTRADIIGLLIEKYADELTRADATL